MRLLSARLIISLIVGVTLVSLCSSYYEVLVEKRGLRRDLQRRAEVLGESLARNVERDLERNAPQTLQRTVQRFANRENLAGLAVYDTEGRVISVTAELAPLMNAAPAVVSQAVKQDKDADAFQKLGTTSVHIVAVPLHGDDKVLGALAIVHDAGYIRDRSLRIWRETFLSALAHVVLIAFITLLIVRWSIEGPIARTAHWMRALRTGRTASTRIRVPDLELFRPLAREVATFAESLTTARSAAETEARLREQGQSQWTADRLAVHVRTRLQDGRLFVVSNREPYRHVRKGRSFEVTVPPSGLVTALEPVLCACDGTWIAHGNGDADLEVVDQHDRLRVPRKIRVTPSDGFGLPRKRSRDTITDLPTKVSGRSATSRTLGPFFVPTIGSTTRRSIASSPMPCWRKCRTPRDLWSWCRTITSRFCPA